MSGIKPAFGKGEIVLPPLDHTPVYPPDRARLWLGIFIVATALIAGGLLIYVVSA